MSASEAGPASPPGGGPLLIAVADDPHLLGNVMRELEKRYAADYRVRCLGSAQEARTALGELAAAGEQVALVLAGELQGETSGTALLAEVQHAHPQAQRVLLVGWGRLTDPLVGDAVFDAISRGRLDHFLIAPSHPPDEEFHQGVSSSLARWAEGGQRAPHTVEVIGRTWSGRASELREVLGRCALPHRFHLATSQQGRALIAAAGTTRLPLIVMPDGHVLEDPSDAEIAQASGTTIDPDGDHFDLVIVGGGPAGLSAGVYGSSEGLRTLVIDSGGIGGQATASSAIRNYLGFPRGVSGGELARRAYQQAWVFGTRFALMQRVTGLAQQRDGIALTLSSGGVAIGRAVILAMGARYRLLGVEPLEALRGAGVFYGAAASEAPTVCGGEVFVVGGANSAGQAALHLAHYARQVTLVVRASSLDIGMSHYLVQQIGATPNIEVRTDTEVVDGGGDGWLEHLTLRRRGTLEEEVVKADDLFLMIGAKPHTDWLPPVVERDDGGFVLTGHDVGGAAFEALGRRPLAMETSVPSVLAAGDVRHGSVKRVASAVGEGSIAIQLVHRLVSA
ncbi:FAD-dependent oxidoreductase [Nocardioides sediminis]|uniref:FAD-dependent oxidoreductase n=1 Tax=Nocardioides sediminis TaxID=433648 RepID=UPI000D30DE65|nr:FAD-dependent oxidoreductase [Nocardioides sediminis]